MRQSSRQYISSQETFLSVSYLILARWKFLEGRPRLPMLGRNDLPSSLQSPLVPLALIYVSLNLVTHPTELLSFHLWTGSCSYSGFSGHWQSPVTSICPTIAFSLMSFLLAHGSWLLVLTTHGPLLCICSDSDLSLAIIPECLGPSLTS